MQVDVSVQSLADLLSDGEWVGRSVPSLIPWWLSCRCVSLSCRLRARLRCASIDSVYWIGRDRSCRRGNSRLCSHSTYASNSTLVRAVCVGPFSHSLKISRTQRIARTSGRVMSTSRRISAIASHSPAGRDVSSSYESIDPSRQFRKPPLIRRLVAVRPRLTGFPCFSRSGNH
jgi:hypothetical protein